MKYVVLDDQLKEKIAKLDHGTVLCDSDGCILAVLQKSIPPSHPLFKEIEIPDFSEEELKRRAAEPGGRKLAEIMADLQKST
jgi:hypothetical protein